MEAISLGECAPLPAKDCLQTGPGEALAGKAVRPSAMVPGVPHELEAICLKAMSKEWVNRYSKAADMADAVHQAATLAQPGEVVLLSPACASFDMFRDYAHRGETFQKAVGEVVHA